MWIGRGGIWGRSRSWSCEWLSLLVVVVIVVVVVAVVVVVSFLVLVSFFFSSCLSVSCVFFSFCHGGRVVHLGIYKVHTVSAHITYGYISVIHRNLPCIVCCIVAYVEGLIPSCGGYCSSADQTAQTCQVIGAPRVCSCLFGTAGVVVAVDPVIPSHPRFDLLRDHMGLCGAPSGDTNLRLFCRECFPDSWGRR